MFTLLSFGLIETWDVLKYCIWKHKKKCIARLIETWDVLKYYVERKTGIKPF